MRKNDSVPSIPISYLKSWNNELIDHIIKKYEVEHGRETDKVVPSVLEKAKKILEEYPSIAYCSDAKGIKTLEEGKTYHCKFLIVMHKYRSMGSIIYTMKKAANLKSADFVEIYDERFKTPRRYAARRFKEFGI